MQGSRRPLRERGQPATRVDRSGGNVDGSSEKPDQQQGGGRHVQQNRPGFSSVALLVSSFFGAAMPTCVVGAVRTFCHQRCAGGGASASETMPSPSGPTAPKTGNPLSERHLLHRRVVADHGHALAERAA